MFTVYAVPIWEQLVHSIDYIQVPLNTFLINRSYDLNKFSRIAFKCLSLEVDPKLPYNFEVNVSNGPQTAFANAKKLELRYILFNEIMCKENNHNNLELVKHPNMHVVLTEPIIVDDAIDHARNTGYFDEYWTLFDVENFVNRIATLSIKSLTYTMSESETTSSETTITFNCDENFPNSFMEFLRTQRIYRGYQRSRFDLDSLFSTLESAKASFPT